MSDTTALAGLRREFHRGGLSRRLLSAGDTLAPAEGLLTGIVLAVAVATVLLSWMAAQAVDWLGFLPGLLPGLMLIGIGAYARSRDAMPRLALYMIALGIFLSFMCVTSIFTYMFFPFASPAIDAQLMQIDQWLGYSWPEFVAGLAAYPALAKALVFVYGSSLWQLVFGITVLACLNRSVDLHRFLMVGIIGLLITIFIWRLAPSLGPSAYVSIPADVAARINLVVDSRYGAVLRDLAANGVPVIAPKTIMGVIGFPSFHMIMACMITWFMQRTPVFLPILAVNIAMVPATLAHGGHHLTDLIGGVVIFALSVAIAALLVPRAKRA